ncbi:MAG TPA: PepSY domain-containing protein [Polyangia bacterium]
MKKIILGLALLAAPSLAVAKTAEKPAITMEAAKKTALAKVDGGTIKSAELEKEKGKLIYSFDIVAPDKRIVEVNVDANSGAIVSVEHESAEKEAAEEKAEKKGKR